MKHLYVHSKKSLAFFEMLTAHLRMLNYQKFCPAILAQPQHTESGVCLEAVEAEVTVTVAPDSAH